MILTIHFDGSAVPKNPGGIAISAYTITDENDQIIHQRVEEVIRGPQATNNLAEWAAVMVACGWVKKNHPTAKLHIKGDSQLVINQLNEVYACRKPHLQKFKDQTLAFLEGIAWDAVWVPRKENTIADGLTKKKYEEINQKPARVEVILEDVGKRYLIGDLGWTMPNDFWVKYQYKVNLDERGIFYFYCGELKILPEPGLTAASSPSPETT
jgi:ribonuclease HI